MLNEKTWPSRHGCKLWYIGNRMYSRFLNHTQVLSFRSCSSINGSSVPDTSNVSAGDYLYKMSSLDVTNFDKADVE